MLKEEVKHLICTAPQTDIVILLDDGHGYETVGKRSHDLDGDGRPELIENHFNNSIVQKVGILLDQIGWKYRLLAEEWWDVPLRSRTDRENHWHEWYDKKTIMISIHANAAEDVRGHGTEIFYWHNKPLSSALADAIQNRIISFSETRNRGLKRSKRGEYNFHMLRNSKSDSAVLVEAAFMTNSSDLSKLMNTAWQDDFARAIVCGIADHLGADTQKKTYQPLAIASIEEPKNCLAWMADRLFKL